jgi:tetratricopeptide (TPR) repeat protein
LFPALWGQWFVRYGRGRYAEARVLAGELLEVAEASGDSGHLLEADHSMWATMDAVGDARAAAPHFERGIALYDPTHHGSQAFTYGGHDAGACCRYHFARAQWFLGHPNRTIAGINDALRHAEQLGHPMTMAITLSFAAFLRYELGDYGLARETAERMVALAKAHEFTGWINNGLVVLACIAARERAERQSLHELHERLKSRSSGAAWHRVINLSLIAEVSCEIGDLQRALDALDAIPEEHRDVIYAPEIRRIRGDVLMRRDQRDDAERCFREAIAIARRRAERSLELRATTSLARLLASTGRRDEARRDLGAIYGWFTEGFDTADLRAAKVLLDELGGTPTRGGAA